MNRNNSFAVAFAILLSLAHILPVSSATMPAPVKFSARTVFKGIEKTPSLSLSVVDDNLDRALIQTDVWDPKMVKVSNASGVYAIKLGAQDIVGFNSAIASKLGTTAPALAQRWSSSLKALVVNKPALKNHMLELIGRSNNETWQRAALFRIFDTGDNKLAIDTATILIAKNPRRELYDGRVLPRFAIVQQCYGKTSKADFDQRPKALMDLIAISTDTAEDIERGTRRESTDKLLGQCLFMRGFAYSELGEYQKAIKDLQQSRTYDRANDITFDRLMNVYFKTNSTDEAKLYIEKELSEHPNDLIATDARARLLISKHSFDEAIGLLKSSPQPDMSTSEGERHSLYIAKALASRNQCEAAHRVMDDCIEKRETLYETLFAAQLLMDLRCGDLTAGMADTDKHLGKLRNDLGILSFAVGAVDLVAAKYADGAMILDVALPEDKSNPYNSQYLLILRTLAARALHDETKSGRLSELSASKLPQSNEWPQPILDFLDGKMDKTALLQKSVGLRQQTEARCYIALLQMVTGSKSEAIANFKWIDESGDADSREYDIARGALAQLSKQSYFNKGLLCNCCDTSGAGTASH
jgi:tetratricopeptide (TPR) repeat protein